MVAVADLVVNVLELGCMLVLMAVDDNSNASRKKLLICSRLEGSAKAFNSSRKLGARR